MRLLMVGLLLMSSGCSFLLARAPKADSRDAQGRPKTPPVKACTHVGPFPYIEAALAAGSVFIGALLLSSASDGCHPEQPCADEVIRNAGLIVIASGAVSGASALYGVDVNAECARYHEEWNALYSRGTKPIWAG